jgi:hypothetical protein
MTRDASLTPPRFDYALYMLPPGGGLAITIIAGDFQSTGLAREGSGRLVFTLDDARAAGVQFRDLERLRTLAIDYDKRGWPRRMHVEIYNLPPETPMQALSAIYDYARQENGDTAMSLTLTQDLFPEGPLGLETVTIDNRWVATGEGRATATYTAGDAAGATGTECWNQDLVEIYFSATWDPFSPRGDEMACIP